MTEDEITAWVTANIKNGFQVRWVIIALIKQFSKKTIADITNAQLR